VTTLRITRGLPGSGKTTVARAWVADDPIHRARVNRDDLRAMVHDSVWLGHDTEKQIQAGRDALVTALLKRGVDVFVDDTNLPSRTARDLRRLAVLAGVGFEVIDLTDVALDVCLERNALRGGRALVPEDRIREMHQKYVAGKPYPLPLADEAESATATDRGPYVPLPDAPRVVLVDIDGTVALMTTRSPFDETRVHEDHPNPAVIGAVRAMAAAGYLIVFCSGRTDGCRAETERWLGEHVAVPYEALHMRGAGDVRKDSVVKAEIFDREIRDRYNVVGVFDDRAQVVRMWRALGLTVFQVAEGEF
jgi:predicted ABC-type ATPase